MYSADRNVSGGMAKRVDDVVLDVEYGAHLARDDLVQLFERCPTTRARPARDRLPEGAVGLQIDVQHAAWPEYSRRLGQHWPMVGEVVEHRVGRDQVEDAVREGKVLRDALVKRDVAAACVHLVEHRAGGIEAVDLVERVASRSMTKPAPQPMSRSRPVPSVRRAEQVGAHLRLVLRPVVRLVELRTSSARRGMNLDVVPHDLLHPTRSVGRRAGARRSMALVFGSRKARSSHSWFVRSVMVSCARPRREPTARAVSRLHMHSWTVFCISCVTPRMPLRVAEPRPRAARKRPPLRLASVHPRLSRSRSAAAVGAGRHGGTCWCSMLAVVPGISFRSFRPAPAMSASTATPARFGWLLSPQASTLPSSCRRRDPASFRRSRASTSRSASP